MGKKKNFKRSESFHFMANTILGIIIMLISTTIMNIGTVLQKSALDKMPKLNEQAVSDNIKGVIKNKKWILGWLMTTTAIILQAVALGQADMTIIQPLIAWGLVVLVIFSHYYLGEKVERNEIIGIAIAVIGVVILGITAGQSRSFNSPDEIYENYLRVNTYIIIGIFLAIILITWAYSVKTGYKDGGILFAFDAAAFSVVGLTFSKGVFSILDLVGFGTAIGLWQVWILLIAWIICSTMAIIFQQMSLQRGKSIVVTPVFNLGSMILPIFLGAVVFLETLTTWKLISIAIMVVGAILLSWPKSSQ